MEVWVTEEGVEGEEFKLFVCFWFWFFEFSLVFVCDVDRPMMRKLDGGTHTGEVYLTEPLEWQGAGSGCWLGQKKVELEAKIRVG